jgi:hypothetical protein
VHAVHITGKVSCAWSIGFMNLFQMVASEEYEAEKHDGVSEPKQTRAENKDSS